MSKLASKLKAVAIAGPPVVVDAVVLAFRRMQFRLMKLPEPDLPKREMVLKIDTVPRKIRLGGVFPCEIDLNLREVVSVSMVYPKPDPEKERRTRATIYKGAGIMLGMFASEDEYHCSLRAFKAAWKGIPLCEEPRC